MDDAEVQIADYFETVTIDKVSGSYYKLRDWIAKVLKEEKESTLAERTEQCAKICDEYWKFGPGLTPAKDEIVSKVTRRLAGSIRALNQPENKS